MDEETAKLQLREAKLLVENQIIKNDGIILIDHVMNPANILKNNDNNKYGKSKYFIPYLLDNGYEIIEHVPPKDIHDISATKIREEMKNG